jgi:hypothetical protein
LSQNRKHFSVNTAEEKTKEDKRPRVQGNPKARKKRMALVAPDIGKKPSSRETRKQENEGGRAAHYCSLRVMISAQQHGTARSGSKNPINL